MPGRGVACGRPLRCVKGDRFPVRAVMYSMRCTKEQEKNMKNGCTIARGGGKKVGVVCGCCVRSISEVFSCTCVKVDMFPVRARMCSMRYTKKQEKSLKNGFLRARGGNIPKKNSVRGSLGRVLRKMFSREM